MKALIVIGTRPQIIKTSVLIEALASRNFETILVHTGQHYDFHLSGVFFQELNLQLPNYNLQVGSGNYKKQLSAGIPKLAEVIHEEKPEILITIGDSNPALLGSLGGLSEQVKLVHCEAGLRSGNISEQEERNRIIVDTISDYLLCSTSENSANLVKEQATGIITVTGDLLKDVWEKYRSHVSKTKPARFNLIPDSFCLFTLHRNSNAYNPARLELIANMLSKDWNIPTIWNVHPGVQNELVSLGLWQRLQQNKDLFLLPPASYLEMRWLQENCTVIVTDSVGLQVEAYLAKKPSVILRSELEYHTLIDLGWSKLVQPDKAGILACPEIVKSISANHPKIYDEYLFGDGTAGQKMAQALA